MTDATIVFGGSGLVAGFRRTLPLAAGVAVFGLVLGTAAANHGLSAIETGLMSALVFAGSAQFLAIQAWTSPPDILALALATLVVNLRYVMQSAALRPWLGPIGLPRALASVFLLADENWALSVAEMHRGGRDAAFLLGTGLCLYLVWLASSVIGHQLGALVPRPERFAVDFVGTAVFLTLLGGFAKGRRDILPWGTAAVVAWGASQLLPGLWYVLLGGLTGSLVGALTAGRGADNVSAEASPGGQP